MRRSSLLLNTSVFRDHFAEFCVYLFKFLLHKTQTGTLPMAIAEFVDGYQQWRAVSNIYCSLYTAKNMKPSLTNRQPCAKEPSKYDARNKRRLTDEKKWKENLLGFSSWTSPRWGFSATWLTLWLLSFFRMNFVFSQRDWVHQKHPEVKNK